MSRELESFCHASFCQGIDPAESLQALWQDVKSQDLHYFQNNFQFYSSDIDSFARTNHPPCDGVLFHAGVAIFIDLIGFKNLHGKDDSVRMILADRVLKTGTMSAFSTFSPSVLIHY